MTRVSSYTLYQCPSCGQRHIKNEYGSVSIYVPNDLHLDSTDIKSCKKCGQANQVKDFICLGLRSKTIKEVRKYKDNFFGHTYRKIDEFFFPPKDIDLVNIYPFI
jgi:hypothetical protein